MIDNFDNLVARCNGLRRKRMIRLSFFISGGFILIIMMAVLYIQSTAPIVSKSPKKSLSTITPKNNPSPIRSTSTLQSQQAVQQSSEYSLPVRDISKSRAFVVQLTSSKSFYDINASRHKIPPKYQSSLAIYAINGFYTLRYIDIYDHASLPQIIQYFKSLGFTAPTAHKYNPERIAISENNVPKLNSIPPSTAPISNEIPIPVTPPATVFATPAKSVSGNHLFSVQTSAKNTMADLINAYSSNPKYETALAITRDFYTQENYVDSAIWAKKANQMNREGEEAWLLYAKSYYAQGRKNEAIGVLELYMNYKDSKAASELLRTWKQTPAN